MINQKYKNQESVPHNEFFKHARKARANEVKQAFSELNHKLISGLSAHYMKRQDLWDLLDSFSPRVSVRELHAILYSIIHGGSVKKIEHLCDRSRNPSESIKYSLKDLSDLEEIIEAHRKNQEEKKTKGLPYSLTAYLASKKLHNKQYREDPSKTKLFDQIERAIKSTS